MNNSLYIFEGNGQPTITAVMTASGTFVMGYAPDTQASFQEVWPQPVKSASAYEIANPMVVQQPQFKILDTAPESFAQALKSEFKDARILLPDKLQAYAHRLTEVAMTLATQPLDVMIVPYRGGLTPSLHLQVMNKLSYPCVPLGFSRGSWKVQWDSIADEFVAHLEKYRDRPSLRIGVIDAAIRGDSSWGMANVLSRTKSHFKKQPWQVVFHLLHAEEKAKYSVPPLAMGIPGLSACDLVFSLELHRVPSLLVEDWDEGIGLKADWGNGVCYYKVTTAGQVICRMPDGCVGVLESSNLPQLINYHIANSITDVMLRDPNLKLKSGN